MATLLRRPEEVQQELGISRGKVYQMLASGELPTVRIGRSVRVPDDALRAWVRERTSPGGSDERAAAGT